MIILVDMDGVIADWEQHFLNFWRQKHPNEFFVPLENRKDFSVEKDYPECLRAKVREIYTTSGFFREIPPIDGAITAIQEILADGHEVLICTSPMIINSTCIQDKCFWVKRHLGEDWLRRTIIVKDKSFVIGDVLIDDRPEIEKKVSLTPVWEHILFNQPYNRHVIGKRRLNWQNYHQVLPLNNA